MHPFPKSEQLQFLLAGQPTLTQLVFNPYGLGLTLDNDCSINVENALSHVSPNGEVSLYEREWRNEKPSHLHTLLERSLISVDTADYLLTLCFEGGDKVLVHSDDSNFEAGQIYGSDGSLIVF